MTFDLALTVISCPVILLICRFGVLRWKRRKIDFAWQDRLSKRLQAAGAFGISLLLLFFVIDVVWVPVHEAVATRLGRGYAPGSVDLTGVSRSGGPSGYIARVPHGDFHTRKKPPFRARYRVGRLTGRIYEFGRPK